MMVQQMGVTSKLVLAFVTLILGAVLIIVIADNTLANTTQSFVANETVSLAPARVGDGTGDLDPAVSLSLENAILGTWREDVSECEIKNFVLRNQSYIVMTATTDYVLDADGATFTVVNNNNMNKTISNSTFVTYNYCANDYLNSGFGRSILNLVGGFFALALLGASVGLFYSIGKDTGIVN